MFDLNANIASKPIMDEPYKRHLRTDEAFQAVQEARETIREIDDQYERDYNEAQRFLAARIAEAEIIAHLEDL